jgi:hypothetical protein
MTKKYCHKIGIANDLEFSIVAKSNLHYHIVTNFFSHWSMGIKSHIQCQMAIERCKPKNEISILVMKNCGNQFPIGSKWSSLNNHVKKSIVVSFQLRKDSSTWVIWCSLKYMSCHLGIIHASNHLINGVRLIQQN